MEKKPRTKTTLNGPWSAIFPGAYRHAASAKRVKCTICGRTFANEGNLANHKKTHKISKRAAETTPVEFSECRKEPRPAMQAPVVAPVAPAPKPKVNAATRQRRPNWKIWNLMKGYEKCGSQKEKESYRSTHGFTTNNYKSWQKRREKIKADAKKRSTRSLRVSSDSLAHFQKARYPQEERKVHKKYKARRARGLVVDGEWLRTQMILEVQSKDPNFYYCNRCL